MITRIFIAVLIIAIPVVLFIIYNDFGCPIGTVTGPDFKDFMTLVGHKNEMLLTISSTDSKCGGIEEFDLKVEKDLNTSWPPITVTDNSVQVNPTDPSHVG